MYNHNDKTRFNIPYKVTLTVDKMGRTTKKGEELLQYILKILNEYLVWYNEKRIKILLGNITLGVLQSFGLMLNQPQFCSNPVTLVSLVKSRHIND